jgi:hypothetical protein
MPDLQTYGFIGLIIAIFWIVQFAQLMSLDDKCFPSRHDKIIWAAAFVLASPLAPFGFLAWKRVYRSYKTVERASLSTASALAKNNQ